MEYQFKRGWMSSNYLMDHIMYWVFKVILNISQKI